MIGHYLDIDLSFNNGLKLGPNSFGPSLEIRTLDDIRKSLSNPNANGPKELYKIAMDVGRVEDKELLIKKNLLYGLVTYNEGKIGNEPVRSQGHIHSVSKSCNYSTPEVYEILEGSAFIYMQERVEDNPGRCFAVKAEKGDIVIVPPNWGHATVSANQNESLVFGAWCVRDFGFEYDAVREKQGLAWYPEIIDTEIIWKSNSNYNESKLTIKSPRDYDEFYIESKKSIYDQFVENNDRFDFVSNPLMIRQLWEDFIP